MNEGEILRFLNWPGRGRMDGECLKASAACISASLIIRIYEQPYRNASSYFLEFIINRLLTDCC